VIIDPPFANILNYEYGIDNVKLLPVIELSEY